jgi:hypothetical protein
MFVEDIKLQLMELKYGKLVNENCQIPSGSINKEKLKGHETNIIFGPTKEYVLNMNFYSDDERSTIETISVRIEYIDGTHETVIHKVNGRQISLSFEKMVKAIYWEEL